MATPIAPNAPVKAVTPQDRDMPSPRNLKNDFTEPVTPKNQGIPFVIPNAPIRNAKNDDDDVRGGSPRYSPAQRVLFPNLQL